MSTWRSTFAAMPRGPITHMGPSHLGKREVPIEWKRYRASLPPRVQEWLNSFEVDDLKKMVDIDISNIKIDRPGHDDHGKPLRKIACNRLTSDPHVDEITNSVQLYREAKQIRAQRLADINQARDARNMDEVSQPPAPSPYIFNPPSFKSLMASKTDSTGVIVIGKQTRLKLEDLKFMFKGKEMDDHEHLHASVKGESKMMLIDNLPTKNEDLENSEEVKENVELMETIEENYQFAKQVSTDDDNEESKEERDHENKKKRKTIFTPAGKWKLIPFASGCNLDVDKSNMKKKMKMKVTMKGKGSDQDFKTDRSCLKVKQMKHR